MDKADDGKVQFEGFKEIFEAESNYMRTFLFWPTGTRR
jgi:hypothetical protein